jgi:membrane protease YdiL (CAAX protease family)
MTPRSLKNALFIFGAVLLLGSFLANFVIVNGFIAQPLSPNAISGEIVPYQVKGKTVYITPTQKAEVTASFVGQSVGFVFFLIYGLLYQRRRKIGPPAEVRE